MGSLLAFHDLEPGAYIYSFTQCSVHSVQKPASRKVSRIDCDSWWALRRAPLMPSNSSTRAPEHLLSTLPYKVQHLSVHCHKSNVACWWERASLVPGGRTMSLTSTSELIDWYDEQQFSKLASACPYRNFPPDLEKHRCLQLLSSNYECPFAGRNLWT